MEVWGKNAHGLVYYSMVMDTENTQYLLFPQWIASLRYYPYNWVCETNVEPDRMNIVRTDEISKMCI